MRKLILASVLLLTSVAAHAGDIQGLGVAANDTPAVTDTAQPLPPVAAPEAQKPAAPAPAAARPEPSRQQASSQPAKRTQARHVEGDEAKARRIAAKYGISW
jgi:hypothetical protein